MKRDIPGYVEKAVFRLEEKPEYIKLLCRLFPDIMRRVSYYIDTSLGHMRDEENRQLEALDKKRREQEKAAAQRSQEA
jgi:hypothetical protein